MKLEEFDRLLEKKHFGAVYYLYGDESYLIERACSRLISALVMPEYRDFNLSVFYGNESRGDEIAETAQTLPFFSDRRLVIVRNATALSAPAIEILSEYIQNPSPVTCLVFLGEKIDQRRRFFQDLKKQDALVEFRRLYENQLVPFIRSEARAMNKDIDGAAADYLIYLAGNNLQELVSQLTKLVAYSGTAPRITLECVREMTSGTKVDSVFDFTNAVGEKDLPRALKSLHTMMKDGQEPIQILFMLVRHFRQLWIAGNLVMKHEPEHVILKALNMKTSFFLPGILRQGKNFSSARMGELFRKFWQADRELKSVRVRPSVILERLTMEICR